MTVLRPASAFRPRASALLLAASLCAACSSGTSSGPDEEPGILQLTAGDLDGPPAAIRPAGFEIREVGSYRVRVTAGTSVVVDSTFPGGALSLRRDFRVEPNTYAVLVQGFQAGDVLLFSGVGQATVAAGDTVPLSLDLDPNLGTVDLTIGGGDSASVTTNGSAPVRVTVRNGEGQPVSGSRVAVTVEPATSGTVTLAGDGETGPNGTVAGTFVPARREGRGELRVAVDGFPMSLPGPRRFNVVSPVDAVRSTVVLENAVFLPADGTSQAVIRVRVVDGSGTPQAGIPVLVRSSRNSGSQQIDTIRGAPAETNALGEVVATLSTFSSSTLAGDATITVEAEGKQLATIGTVSFRSLVSAADVEIDVNPIVVPPNGTSTAAIRVQVRSSTGAPLPNRHVRLQTKDNVLFILLPESGRTDASGVFRAAIASLTAESTFIDVYADGLRTSASGFVIFRR